jgi:tetratricopeptide (TPR) repeat protein
MSMTLNMVDRLLERGRLFQQLGRVHDAIEILGRLAKLDSLPAEVSEETQARLAEIRLERNQLRRARRHLTAALVYQPNNARYHLLMARAVEADGRADPERALEHYRRSLELDPDQPECLSKCGLLSVRQGQSEAGLDHLRRAVELDADNPELLQRLVHGLCLLRRPDEARKALRIALFRHARDHRFQKLWNDFQFEQLRKQQESEAMTGSSVTADTRPTILPFIRPTREAAQTPAIPKIIRQDSPECTRPPHHPRITRLPRRRHAQ